jgi:ricin-type beta-trefoil lectin protein/putative Ig domain-containing protein
MGSIGHRSVPRFRLAVAGFIAVVAGLGALYYSPHHPANKATGGPSSPPVATGSAPPGPSLQPTVPLGTGTSLTSPAPSYSPPDLAPTTSRPPTVLPNPTPPRSPSPHRRPSGTTKVAPVGGPVTGPSGNCIDDEAQGVAAGNPIQMWGCDQTVAQDWRLTSIGEWQVLGKCMTAQGGATSAGTPVVIGSCAGSADQLWTERSTGAMVDKASGLCLDDPVNGGWGTRLVIAACNDIPDEIWSLPPTNGTSITVTRTANQASLVGATADLHIAAHDSAAGRTLTYKASGLPSGLSIGSHSGTITGTLATSAIYHVTVAVSDGHGTSGSGLFTWTVSGPITGDGGLCIDDTTQGKTKGNPIQVWGCDQTVAQYWALGPSGMLEVLGVCMTVNGGATASGTAVVIGACTGIASQRWQAGGGELVNTGSGLCLDDPAGGSWGTKLEVATCTGAAEQQWNLQ